MFRLFYDDQLIKFSLIVSKFHIISSNSLLKNGTIKKYHFNDETYF